MRPLLTALIFCAVMTATHAQTAAEQDACRPDAFAFCGGCVAKAIGETFTGHKIDRRCFYACFRQHRKELSAPCDAVLKSHRH